MRPRVRRIRFQPLESRRLLASDLALTIDSPPAQYVESELASEVGTVTTLHADTAEIRIRVLAIEELSSSGTLLATHERDLGQQQVLEVDALISNQGNQLVVSIDADVELFDAGIRLILPHGHFAEIRSQLPAVQIDYQRDANVLSFLIDDKPIVFEGTNLTVLDNLSVAQRSFRLTTADENISVSSGDTIFVRAVDANNTTSNRLAMGFIQSVDRIDLMPAEGDDIVTVNGLGRIGQLRIDPGLNSDEQEELIVPDGFEIVAKDTVESEILLTISDGTSTIVFNATRNGSHNPVRATDVNFDTATTAFDALLIINALDGRQISDDFFRDVNNDSQFTALDALIVINRLALNSESELPQVSDQSLLELQREEDDRRDSLLWFDPLYF